MDKHVFRAYDIRGIYGKEISAKDAVKVGAGFAEFVGGDKIVVGHDARLSSPLLAKAAIAGICSTGRDVIFIGMASTPEIFYAAKSMGLGGLCVGASHNPPEYCGFKFAKADGTEYSDETLQELYRKIGGAQEIKGAGTISEASIREKYMENIVTKISQRKKLKIAIDVMHGCGGAGGEILRRLGNTVEILNGEPDGKFGGKTPEPKEETLGELAEEVVASRADFGCAFDGDADRSVFVDEKGRIIGANAVIMLMAQYESSKGRAPTVVATVNCSQKVEDFVNTLGGALVWSKVGRVYIEKLVVETGALIAGEESSHFWFPQFYPFSDGPLAAAKFAEMVGGLKRPLSEEVAKLGLGVEKKGKVTVGETKKAAVMGKVVAALKLEGKWIDIDGIKLIKDDYWVIVRASNTEPILRINAEAPNEKRAELVLAKYIKIIEGIAKAV